MMLAVGEGGGVRARFFLKGGRAGMTHGAAGLSVWVLREIQSPGTRGCGGLLGEAEQVGSHEMWG